jgi:hypothetical protein
MRCYEARRTKSTPKFQKVDVTLRDQFITTPNAVTATVKVHRQLCNPASVDGSFVAGADPTAHLTCYATKDQKGTPRFKHVNVEVTNDFGTQQLTLSKPFRLCVPSEKGIVPAAPTPSSLVIDHYRCYKANFKKGFVFTPPTGKAITDQFESTTADVRFGNRLIFCNPVSKNGAPILDPANHLTCFRLLAGPSGFNINVAVDNQFGNDQRLTVRRTGATSSVCLPSTKTVLPRPAGRSWTGARSRSERRRQRGSGRRPGSPWRAAAVGLPGPRATCAPAGRRGSSVTSREADRSGGACQGARPVAGLQALAARQHGGERAFELPPAVLPPAELALDVTPTAAPLLARRSRAAGMRIHPTRRRWSLGADGRSPLRIHIVASGAGRRGSSCVRTRAPEASFHERSSPHDTLLLAAACAASRTRRRRGRTSLEAKGKLRPDFFQRFVFRGRVPTTETTLVWKVIQTYRDGTVVRWTGEPGEEEASETKVTPAAP